MTRNDTTFQPGNQAARKHGLRAGTRKELRRRDTRTSRLFGRYQLMRAEEGRALEPTQVPLGRRYCELEIRCRDLYAGLTEDPLNTKLHEMYISAVRAQSAIAAQLGETVPARLRIEALTRPAEGLATLIARERQQLALEGKVMP